MSKTTQKTPLQNLLITTSENAAGFSVSGITGYAPELVRRVANALVKSGDLVRAKLGARSVRYFANDDLARAYQAGQAPARRGATAVLGPRTKARWSADEPGIITPQTKIYIAPPLPRRVLRTNTYPQF